MKQIMHKARLLAAIALTLIVCGCASTQKLSEVDRAKFKTARINQTVQKGQLFLLAPSGANVGLIFGAIGGAAASGSIADTQKSFTDFLDKNSLSIEKIVREEFEKALKESGKLAIAGPEESSAPVINISVPQYGFGVTHLLSSNVVPVIQVKCDLVDSSAKLIWSENERMLPSIASPMQSTTWAQLHDDPKQIEEQWRKASRILVKKIIDTL
ncbi:MAG: hypothetical protein V4488_21680 [Pseudomonadota bacterium]